MTEELRLREIPIAEVKTGDFALHGGTVIADANGTTRQIGVVIEALDPSSGLWHRVPFLPLP